MRIAIRTDASLEMGTGHVMRCLTLAEEMHRHDFKVRFICRAHPGHLADMISSKGFEVTLLPKPIQRSETSSEKEYVFWVGASQKEDALQTISVLQEFRPDWIVVDNYGLDCQWERTVQPHVKHIMAIDGLANRRHECDLLLDPNYTKLGQDRWKNLIPARCHLFVGPEYALLRPIFFEYKRSNRHRNGKIRRILIAFGGVDVKNATKKALEAVAGLNRSDIVTDIVVGATNPHCEEIFETFGYIPNINIHRQTMGMAELMDKADLSIGAGGSMMWERCCMGLPALVIILAENQVSITEAVDEFGAIINLGAFEEITVWGIRQNILNLLENPDQVKLMSQRCRQLSGEKNCSGANIICNSMISDFVK